MTVYHYTTTSNLEQIILTKQFQPSSFIVSDDSTYGQGWYFTDLPPSTNIIELLTYLWGITDNHWLFTFKAKSYINYEIDTQYLDYCRPHVWKLRHNVLSHAKHLTINQNYLDNNSKVVIKYLRHGER